MFFNEAYDMCDALRCRCSRSVFEYRVSVVMEVFEVIYGWPLLLLMFDGRKGTDYSK